MQPTVAFVAATVQAAVIPSLDSDTVANLPQGLLAEMEDDDLDTKSTCRLAANFRVQRNWSVKSDLPHSLITSRRCCSFLKTIYAAAHLD